ncbi:MAG TPA: response regulator transcription factor [Anaerolineaceae bacterium]|jgi:DNA-binding NarL/FixJ family response regulator
MGAGIEEIKKEMIRVLIADDHPAVRQSLRELLSRQQDIQVVGEAINGEEAVSLVSQVHPDVLLLDIEMPVLDGIEVTRELRHAKSGVRIIILSGHADKEYIRLVMQQGVFGYLVKDAPPGRIADAIRTVAGGKKLSRRFLPAEGYRFRLSDVA